MKKIYKIKIGFIAVLLSVMTSCEDAINITQAGELYREDTYKTVGDLQKGLNGLMAQLSESTEIGFASIFTDEVSIGFQNSGQGIGDGGYTYLLRTDSSVASSIWLSNYAMINTANRLLRAANLISEDNAQKKDIVARIHIIRAWAHFKLVSYFSEDMTKDDYLGCIIMDHVPVFSEKLPRNTNGEVFTFIDADLQYVNDLLPNNVALDKTYISPNFVTAFKARMAAYRGRYADAKVHADLLIDAMSLTPSSEYSKIWTDDSSIGTNEVIFKLERVSGNSRIGQTWAVNNATISGTPNYEMSTKLFEFLVNDVNEDLNDQNDVRAAAFIEPTSILSNDPTENYALIGKYAQTEAIPLLADLKVFRLSEMYFIRAEVAAAEENWNDVKSYLQYVVDERFKAGTPDIAVPTSKAEAFREILKQRRIELCFEGHRWMDLRRLGRTAGVSIDRHIEDCKNTSGVQFVDQTIPNDDHRFTLPIPKQELGANPKIRPQQNTGYTNL